MNAKYAEIVAQGRTNIVDPEWLLAQQRQILDKLLEGQQQAETMPHSADKERMIEYFQRRTAEQRAEIAELCAAWGIETQKLNDV